ncbi:MAG: hypothetical protein GY796_02375 [Chloroflexi bacterium]|nr:hypothetical protein [Chloroflexota bacterium]
MKEPATLQRPLPFGFYIKLTLLVWLAMIAVDFFLHGGLLASLYLEPGPFLLPPEQAFAFIPLGYLSFLLLAILLLWLMTRLGIQGWRNGLIFGLQLGGLIWGALMLGLLSISTIPAALAAGWFAGQTIELGVGGLVAGSGLAQNRLGRLALKVIGLIFGAFILTIILQNVGLAPAVVR